MEEMVEIRWHGRGGQGVILASEIMADAALLEGMFFQALPEFGAERSGAPIRAYTRLSSRPIQVHYAVTEPDVVVVLDPTLIAAGDLTQGLKPGGLILINSPESPEKVRARLGSSAGSLFTVDASAIAKRAIGRNIPNVPILGALLAAIPLISVANLTDAVERRMRGRIREEVIQGNLSALTEGAKQLRQEELAHRNGHLAQKQTAPAPNPESWRGLTPGAVILNPGNSVEYETGVWRSERPIIDWSRCSHCLLCWIYCPDSCFHVEQQRLASVDYAHCKGCGICVVQCPTKCIEMAPELTFQEG